MISLQSKFKKVVYIWWYLLVKCNIFSELTPKAFLLFFPKEIYWNCYRKILRDNCKPNQTLSINFVLKLRFRENLLWNENLKPNVAWKFTLRDNPNFAEKLCVDFFKFRKYYAAHNSGLKNMAGFGNFWNGTVV